MSDSTVQAVAAQTMLLATRCPTLADANHLAAGLLATAERRARETVEAARREAAEIVRRAQATVTDVQRAQHGELVAAFADTRREMATLVEAALARIEARTDDLAAESRAHDARAQSSLDEILRALAENRARQRGEAAQTDESRSAATERARAAHPTGPARPRIVASPPAPLASVRITGRPPRVPTSGWSAPVIELVRPRGPVETVSGTIEPSPGGASPAGRTATRRGGRRVAAS